MFKVLQAKIHIAVCFLAVLTNQTLVQATDLVRQPDTEDNEESQKKYKDIQKPERLPARNTRRIGDLKPTKEKPMVLVDRYKPREKPGRGESDPHEDGNGEVHDGGLPSNKHAGDGYPSDDPYNGSTSNNKDSPTKPY